MKKRFSDDTEFANEFINPVYELDMTLQYTNDSVDKEISNKKRTHPKK